MKRVYVQSGTDDGGFASRGLALLGDSAAVMPASEFVEVLRTASAPTDDATSEEASMKSVPGVPAPHYTDTRSPCSVHTLSVATLLAPESEVWDEAEWHRRNVIGSLDDGTAGIPLPVASSLDYRFSRADADADQLRAFGISEARRYAAAVLLDTAGGLDEALQAVREIHAHHGTTQPLPDVPLPAGHRRLHALADRDGWTCYLCGVGLIDACSDQDMLYDGSGGRYANPASLRRMPQVEHKVPRSLGGSSRPINLGLACAPCNLRKGSA